MKLWAVKIFVVLFGVVFLADDVNVDIAIARVLNAALHTHFHAIPRDCLENASRESAVKPSATTITIAMRVAIDEDSPSALDTAFPRLETALNIYEREAIAATSRREVTPSYLVLHTLII